MMTKLLQNKGLAVVVLLIYWIAVTLPHEIVGRFINENMEVFSKETYNLIVLITAVVVIAGLALWASVTLRKHPYFRLWMIYFGITALLIFLSMYYLFIINIEVVHFLQYAVFAFLCYAVVQNYYSILGWTILAGALDELHQYLILRPDGTSYYDFNDIWINTVGGLMGLLMLFLLGYYSQSSTLKKKVFSLLTLCYVMLFTVFLVTLWTGWSSYTWNEDSTFIIFKEMPEGFWSWVGKQIVYHIMRPWEYFLLLGAVMVLYRPIFKSREMSIVQHVDP